MNLSDYVKNAVRTESLIPDFVSIPARWETLVGAISLRSFEDSSILNSRVVHAALGINTEVGEYLDALKKHIFYGRPLDEVNLKEELGDMMWYMAILCDVSQSNLFARGQEIDFEEVVAKAKHPFEVDEPRSYTIHLKRAIEAEGVPDSDPAHSIKLSNLLYVGGWLAGHASVLLELSLGFSQRIAPIKREFERIVCGVNFVFGVLETSWELEAQRNIDKLKDRYPDAFTVKDALERDLGSERLVLESHETESPS